MTALHADSFLWLQAQQALAQTKAQQAALTYQQLPKPAPVPMPITTLALPGPASTVAYSVRGLLRDINLEVRSAPFAMTACCATSCFTGCTAQHSSFCANLAPHC